MKFSLPLVAVALLLMLGLSGSRAFAQSASAGPSAGVGSQLTPSEKAKMMMVRHQAFEANPGLEAEGDALMQQGQNLRNAPPEEKMAFLKKVEEHQQKVKAAMLKIDPTLGPVIDKAQATGRAKFRQQTGEN